MYLMENVYKANHMILGAVKEKEVKQKEEKYCYCWSEQAINRNSMEIRHAQKKKRTAVDI